jgi:uncharacterized repeat protein (TIGR01451 family)
MSKSKTFAQWGAVGIAVVVLLGLALMSRSMPAMAAPPAAPIAGITVTPTPGMTPTPTVTPTSTVTPTPTGEEPGPTETPEGKHEYTDPVIVKSSDPTEARPGEEVTFTLHVINKGNIAAVGVVVTDDIPAYLEILEVTATQGEITIDGQRVTVYIGTMGPEFEVSIVIRTRVRPETPAPLTLENVAILACPNCQDRWARAEVDIIGPDLPVTGGLGTWWMVAACLGTGLVGLSLALSRRETR